MTVAEAAYDVMLRLGQNSDDISIGYRDVLQWLDISRARILREYIMEGNDIPNTVKKELFCQAVKVDKSECGDCDRYYVDLKFSVMDLPRDMGIVNVYRPGGKTAERLISEASFDMIGNRFRPSHGWWRIDKRVYLHGNWPEDISLRIVIVPSNTGELDENDTYPAPDVLLEKILEAAEKIGERELARPVDLNNDGKHSTNA